MGGKTRLLPELLRRIPASFGRYYEPFAGGAALFFKLAPTRAVLGDANADLMAMYRAVAENVDGVIRDLRMHSEAHNERHYYATRDAFKDHVLSIVGHAAAFIYLNKTCFNGLYRVNQRGEFNVPIGDYRNPTIYDEPALRAAAEVLARTELRSDDYRPVVRDAIAGDLVYFDPPYDDTFNAYTPDKFDQAALAETARELVARGCHVMLSNSDTPLVRKLYRDFSIEVVRSTRSVNADGAGRGDVDELIITNSPKKAISMSEQTLIPGTEPPDRVPAIETAIAEWLNAKEEQRRAAAATKTKHAAIVTLYQEHAVDAHPYTCPRTGKPKRLWLAKEPKAKSSSIAQPRLSGRRRGGPRRDVDAEIAEPKEDTTVEMRRVPRSSVVQETDAFASVRERMEAKKADAEKKAKRPKKRKG